MRTKLIFSILIFTGILFAHSASATSNVFYSVGQNTDDHKTGSPTISVSGFTATLSVGQTAANMGVGDVITYSGGSCFLSGKTSQTVWSCTNATGGTAPQVAAGTSVTSITHAFASLKAAIGIGGSAPDASHLNTANLTTADVVLNIPCYYDSGGDTGEVTINGYTTDATRYIKVYTPTDVVTEANTNQRHDGVWSDTKYNISAPVYPQGDAIAIQDQYVRIIGLQLKRGGSGTYNTIAIEVNSSNADIEDNIMDGAATYDNDSGGISIGQFDEPVNVYNNIIYNFRFGIYCYDNGGNGYGTVYIYNNTLVDNTYGLETYYSDDLYVKNNLAVGGTAYVILYNQGAAFTTANNISSDDTSPNSGVTDCGGHSCRNQTVSFVDSGNDNFHLSGADTSAKNSGVDLSATFTTDIDGQTRPTGASTWDIGADERLVDVYYSVGQNTGDLKNGSPTLTIDSSGNGTLSVAQTGNMGVGDYIEYGTAPYTKAYISGKTSSIVWTVKSVVGDYLGVGTTMPVNSIKHTFSTLNGALAAADTTLGNANLVTAGVILNIACYYDSAVDTTAASTTSDYTTGAANYIRIFTPSDTSTEANFSQRHEGKWDDAKYRLAPANDNGVYVTIDNLKIEGLQIKTSGSNNNGIRIDGNDSGSGTAYVASNIIDGTGTTSSSGIIMYFNTVVTGKIYNNIIYNYSGSSDNGMFIYASAGLGSHYVYNNTIINTTVGFNGNGPYSVLKNNITQSCPDGYSDNVSGASGMDYNISDVAGDTTGFSASYRSGLATTVNFVDTANKDFHLAASDTAARESGTSLSADANLAFSIDINGHTRPTLDLWDIGADEGATHIYYSVGQNTSDHRTLGAGGSAPTVTVSGFTATLNVGQTAANMGVGDVITYTGGSCYISGKTSNLVWSCQNAIGGMAAQVTDASVTSIAHAFSSLNQAIGTSGSAPTLLGTADLKMNNYVLNIPCYYDSGADTTAVTISGYATAAPNYIKVYTSNNTTSEANASQRHSGKWNSDKYSIDLQPSDTANGIDIETGHTEINGLQIYMHGSAWSQSGVYFNANYAKILNSIIRGNSSGSSHGISSRNSTNGDYSIIANNILYNHAYNVYIDGLYGVLYNNTASGCATNCYIVSSGYSEIARNNIANPGVSGDGFYTNSNFSSGSTNNTSSDNTVPTGVSGDIAGNIINATFNFIDSANGDFHLANNNNASAINLGVDLLGDAYYAFSTDIDGQTRTPGKWDIGADENNNVTIEIKSNVNFGKNVIFK
ncbi:MAG: hypothetical protein WCV59_00120 [Parcubacteria group bacterium]|jgi:hypothetical protein